MRKIVTHCPHCFNTLKNEYPQFGGYFEVIHHSQLIDQLLAAGRITPTQATRDKVTYHDACYLGRHNGVFASPRQALGAIPGVRMQEMQWNQRRGLCCGAGGGHAFMEINIGQRVNHIRTEQAVETGADVVATGWSLLYADVADGVKAKVWKKRCGFRTLPNWWQNRCRPTRRSARRDAAAHLSRSPRHHATRSAPFWRP